MALVQKSIASSESTNFGKSSSRGTLGKRNPIILESVVKCRVGSQCREEGQIASVQAQQRVSEQKAFVDQRVLLKADGIITAKA